MTFSFTKLATTALTGLAALGFASASYATPTQTQPVEGSLDAHAALVEAIEAQGVDFIVNHEFCDENPDVMGFYSSHYRVLVVCNDKFERGVNEDPQWTANDLDTLRHEAQHLIQDCMVGGLADSKLYPVYKDPIGLAYGILGADRMQGINTLYRQNGADNETILLEWEAFSVAAMNVPLEQSQDIARFCGA